MLNVYTNSARVICPAHAGSENFALRNMKLGKE